MLTPAAELEPTRGHLAAGRTLAGRTTMRLPAGATVRGPGSPPPLATAVPGAAGRGHPQLALALLAVALLGLAAGLGPTAAAAPVAAAVTPTLSAPGPQPAGPTASRGVWPSVGRILLLLAVAYVSLAAYLFVFQSRYIYFPAREMISTPELIGLRYEDVWLTTADGGQVHGWYVPAADRERGVVLKCHGNGGNVSNRLEALYQFHTLGLSTLIFDYRGYGRSPGTPTESGTYADAEAAWEYLTRTRGVPPERIVVFGRSLGCAVAAWLARAHTPCVLVLESPFASVPDIGREVYPFLPVGLLSRFRYATRDMVREVGCPVVVIHSPQDEIVAFHHGRDVFAAAPEPKQFIEISGGHNDGFLTHPSYMEDLDAALSRWLPTVPAAPPPAAKP